MAVTDTSDNGPASKYTRFELRRQAKDHLIKGHAWPEGRLRRSAPKEALLVQELVKRLKAAMGDRGLEEIEELSGVNKTSIRSCRRPLGRRAPIDHGEPIPGRAESMIRSRPSIPDLSRPPPLGSRQTRPRAL